MTTEAAKYYAGLGAVIGSAAAVVATVFTLFNSVLTELMPNVEGAGQTVNFVSFGTLVVLLALTLLIRKRLSTISQYVWAGIAIACLVGAAFTYLSFGDLVRLRVYLYPPATAPGTVQQPYVSGPYHDVGRERAGTLDIATAVSKFGGPPMVNGRQTLWTTEARSKVVGEIIRYYMALAFLMVTALFTVSIAVWRTLARTSGTRTPATGDRTKESGEAK